MESTNTAQQMEVERLKYNLQELESKHAKTLLDYQKSLDEAEERFQSQIIEEKAALSEQYQRELANIVTES